MLRPMRRPFALALAAALLSGACGDDDPGLSPSGTPSGSDRPECDACYQALVAETDLCGPALDACLNDPTLPVEPIVQCFQAEGRCFDDALRRSASCNETCGDTSQAQVELCAAVCFRSRADCAERVVRGVDACLSVCGGAACDQCTFNGQLEFDTCNAKLEACADQCVRDFRD